MKPSDHISAINAEIEKMLTDDAWLKFRNHRRAFMQIVQFARQAQRFKAFVDQNESRISRENTRTG